MKELAERIQRGRLAIALAKKKGLDTSQWEQHLKALFAAAGREPSTDAGVEPWMLWQWRRVSIPQWRRILTESIEQHDERRDEYARWMLRDILLDPAYQEDN